MATIVKKPDPAVLAAAGFVLAKTVFDDAQRFEALKPGQFCIYGEPGDRTFLVVAAQEPGRPKQIWARRNVLPSILEKAGFTLCEPPQ